jgi:2-polyprenyl-6-methoxyphenol hydroxylase-like FAD-dependent oxidoreductase
MSGQVETFDVVVVGAGPAGLASAITLGSHGVEVLVIDKRLAPSTLPRSTTASTGTMELLRRWGLEGAARERAMDVALHPWATETMAGADAGQAVDAGFPTREQAALISPTAPAALGQDELEPLLEARARSLAGVRIERGVELTALERPSEGGYLLALAGPRKRQVRARYVVGADGPRSRIRQELGIATEGSETVAERLTVHFRAPIWNLVGDRRHVIYFLTGEQEGESFLPAGEPDRWVFALPWDASKGDSDRPTAALMKRWIRDAAGDPGLPVEIERSIPVTFGIGLAERFRDGDTFLIGDAAHRVTPRGGTGLNTAIRDGFDLGWKLGWVLRGWAGDDLLESYERERRPVAEFNTERTARPDGSILPTSFGLNADIGGRIAHVWVARDHGLVSTLDLLGEGLTLFAGPDWDGSVPRGYESAPVAVERLDAITAVGLGLTAEGSMLVRPDGRPVGLWNLGGGKPSVSGHASSALASR